MIVPLRDEKAIQLGAALRLPGVPRTEAAPWRLALGRHGEADDLAAEASRRGDLGGVIGAISVEIVIG